LGRDRTQKGLYRLDLQRYGKSDLQTSVRTANKRPAGHNSSRWQTFGAFRELDRRKSYGFQNYCLAALYFLSPATPFLNIAVFSQTRYPPTRLSGARVGRFDFMEISDRRYQELLESIAIGQGRTNAVRFARRTARELALSIARETETKRIEHQWTDLPPALARVTREVKEILLVDPEADRLVAAQNALRPVADVFACSEFQAARVRLLARPPDLLVTNLRLEAYNGLHLVHLTEGTATRCIVYGTVEDRFLAREVQTAGAFYEHSLHLPRGLASYVRAVLPPRDRRDPSVLDRRQTSRGGRRSTES
jgi:hypothetical protein